MIFCKKCGSLMLPDNKKKAFVCGCGNIEKEAKLVLKDDDGKKIENVEVIEEKNLNPLTDAICPKCKHDKAHWWAVQMRGADEPESIFFQCEKCKHTWRQK